MNRVLIGVKKQDETVFCPFWGFDFTSVLGASETISSASVDVLVYTGVDSNPSAMKVGTPTVNGAVVMQLLTGGQVGTIYTLWCRATTSLGQIISLTGFLTVILTNS